MRKFLTRHKDKRVFPTKNKSSGVNANIDGNISPSFSAAPSKDLFSRVEDAVESTIKDLEPDLSSFIVKQDLVTDYGRQELKETLQCILKELELSMLNEDWDFIVKQRAAKKQFTHILERTLESAVFWTKMDWGREEVTREKPKTKGEELGQKLWEPFERWKDEFLAQFPPEVRDSEFAKSKRAVERFIDRIGLMMIGEIREFR